MIFQTSDISTVNGSSLKLVDKFTYLGSSFSSTETDIDTRIAKAWKQTKWMEKRIDDNYTRMWQAILNKSWRQHPTKQQLYGHLPSITKTIKVKRSIHSEYCWRSRDKLIIDVLLQTPSHCRAKAVRPARTYIQQLCVDTGYSPGDMAERWTIGRGGDRGSGISMLIARADDIYIYIYIYLWECL